ncbi:SDR family NAD(P)-dependent oxidoreductase [[Eubacterium] cellulosolvens]
MKLENRIGIVTGAGKGIGREVALTLSDEGAQIVIADIDEENMKKTADLINSKGGKAITVRTNVAFKEDVKNLVKKTVENYNRIDILINCAGILSTTPFLEVTEQEWNKVLDVNLKGVLFCCQETLPIMLKQKSGKIVNIASLSAKRGGVTSGVDYCSSKAGVVALTRSLAKYAAPHNIIVNAVAPGIIDTEMIHIYPPGMREKQIRDIPLKRLGRPDEVAKVIAFLVSDDANYIVGETININGGLLMD